MQLYIENRDSSLSHLIKTRITVMTGRVRTIVTIGLSLRLIVALSDDYRSGYFFTDCCTDSATNCHGRLSLIYDIHSEVVSTAMLLFSELLNCDSMLA